MIYKHPIVTRLKIMDGLLNIVEILSGILETS